MSRVEIDWSSAEVHDRELSVALDAQPSAAWRARFKALHERLRQTNQPWGRVTAKKDRLLVEDVAEGMEGDVRHLLESLVLQANAAEQEPEDDGDPADARLTDAFRAFGERSG